MSDVAPPPVCLGRSARGQCPAPPLYRLTRQAGPNRVGEHFACGRHLAWVVNYCTVPGQDVALRRLPVQPSRGRNVVAVRQPVDLMNALRASLAVRS